MEYGNREELPVADPEFRRLNEEHRQPRGTAPAPGGQDPPLRGRGNGREATQEGEAPPEGPHGSDRPQPPRGGRPLRIPLAREGWVFILPALVAGTLLASPGAGPPPRSSTRLTAVSAPVLSRSRSARPRADADTIVSPADGTVLSIAEAPEAPPGARRRLSIFMSVFNCHVNRVAGRRPPLRLRLRPRPQGGGVRRQGVRRERAEPDHARERAGASDLQADRGRARPAHRFLSAHGRRAPPRRADRADQVRLARRPLPSRRRRGPGRARATSSRPASPRSPAGARRS